MIFIISNLSRDSFWTIAAAIGSFTTVGTFIFIILKYLKDKQDYFWDQFDFSILEVSRKLNIIKSEFLRNAYENSPGKTEKGFINFIKQCAICFQDIIDALGSARYLNLHLKISIFILMYVLNQIQTNLEIITREPTKWKMKYTKLFPYIDEYMQNMLLFITNYSRDFTLLTRTELIAERKRQRRYSIQKVKWDFSVINDYLQSEMYKEYISYLILCLFNINKIFNNQTQEC